jgi:hypothetical protein
MRQVLIAVAILAVPRVALACPVCFGQSDSPLALGANMGIWVMLGITGAMLSAFASFFIYLMRRAKLAAEDERRRDESHDVQEGIA